MDFGLIVIYRDTLAIEIKSLLKNKREIDLGIISSTEARSIMNDAKQLNLQIIAKDVSVTSYLPIDLKTNFALIIEDNDLAEKTIGKMIEAGIPIVDYNL